MLSSPTGRVLAEEVRLVSPGVVEDIECAAVAAALERAAQLRLEELEVRLDSRVVVEWLTAVRRPAASRRSLRLVTAQLAKFGHVSFRWVRGTRTPTSTGWSGRHSPIRPLPLGQRTNRAGDRVEAGGDDGRAMSVTLAQMIADARAAVGEIPPADAREGMESGAIGLVLDVREPHEFAKERLHDSINIPRGMLELRADERSPGADTVLTAERSGRVLVDGTSESQRPFAARRANAEGDGVRRNRGVGGRPRRVGRSGTASREHRGAGRVSTGAGNPACSS